jgi:osmotically-inducible protein OsmY
MTVAPVDTTTTETSAVTQPAVAPSDAPNTTASATTTAVHTVPNTTLQDSSGNIPDTHGVAVQTADPANTKINERDRHGSLTPMDQGNSRAETKISADIRKGIMHDSTLSFTAKNVKVITVGTKVTLRGPVKSEQEKSAIEALAKQTAGVTEVDNQLEVKK